MSKKQQNGQKEGFEHAEGKEGCQESEERHQGGHSQTQDCVIEQAFVGNQQLFSEQASFKRLK